MACHIPARPHNYGHLWRQMNHTVFVEVCSTVFLSAIISGTMGIVTEKTVSLGPTSSLPTGGGFRNIFSEGPPLFRNATGSSEAESLPWTWVVEVIAISKYAQSNSHVPLFPAWFPPYLFFCGLMFWVSSHSPLVGLLLFLMPLWMRLYVTLLSLLNFHIYSVSAQSTTLIWVYCNATK